MFLTKQGFFEILEGNRRLTIRVIEAFSEEQLFNFTPDEKLRPFAEMVKEIVNIEYGYMQGIARDKWEYKDVFEGTSTKEELIRISNNIREETRNMWAEMNEEKLSIVMKDEFFGPEQSHFDRLQYALENEIHHRGQGYTYLRLLGIEPPEFYVR
ncbi:DinB family protein [Fictibacillus nanhaiensis]|uniref:DinB family protein n=1 Tax=Fictibacillus nanhaiensis TaxID=742169 RepID=A0ABS2ZWM7_9BACL|nr:DinB family protein [Fictibacillus nanhaiensis]